MIGHYTNNVLHKADVGSCGNSFMMRVLISNTKDPILLGDIKSEPSDEVMLIVRFYIS